MKRVITIYLMLWLINHTSWAQTEAGKKFIGGQIQIQSTFSEDRNGVKIFRYDISPYAGYFIRDHLSIGGGISFSNIKVEIESNDYEYINQNLTIFAASRYYIPIGEAKKFYAYLQGSLSYSRGKTENTDATQELLIRRYTLNISPGFTYFPSPRWGLELDFSGLSFNVFDIKDRDNYTSLTLGADSFAPSLGVSYYF
jgi:hypothetical protein